MFLYLQGSHRFTIQPSTMALFVVSIFVIFIYHTGVDSRATESSCELNDHMLRFDTNLTKTGIKTPVVMVGMLCGLLYTRGGHFPLNM